MNEERKYWVSGHSYLDLLEPVMGNIIMFLAILIFMFGSFFMLPFPINIVISLFVILPAYLTGMNMMHYINLMRREHELRKMNHLIGTNKLKELDEKYLWIIRK